MIHGLVVLKNFNLLLLLYCFLHCAHGYRNKPKMKVCVIGAGSAGISVTRHLAKNLDEFEITTFEKQSEVGGTWVYTNKTGVDSHGYPIHCSMYKHLRTNVPKEIMNFPDWPKVQGVNTSCVPHYVVMEYLRNYTDHFKIRPFIQFNTIVENVTLLRQNGRDKWNVTVKDLESSVSKVLTFDVVIVCNGHYFTPNIPAIQGIKDFRGKVLHSHDYRDPEDFRNKTVLILGAASSGVDIGQELANVTYKLFLSHNYDKIPVSLNQVKGISRFENGVFVLKDNSSVTADVLMFCTGYKYTYPFLDSTTGIKVEDNFVTPLYKHIVNIDHPSMMFVGVSSGIIPFPMFHQQSQFVVSLLKGKAMLPQMTVLKQDARLKTRRKKDGHTLLNSWNYTDELAYSGGFSQIPEYYKIAHEAWMKHWHTHYDDFKEYNLVIEQDRKSFKIIKQSNPKSHYFSFHV